MIRKINLLLHVALFPFKDLAFYMQSGNPVLKLAEVTPVNSGLIEGQVIAKQRKKLSHILHRNILLKCSPDSLDEINLMLEIFYPFFVSSNHAWNQSIYKHYLGIMESFAKAFISHRDGEIVFKYWKNGRNESESNKYDRFWSEYKELDKVHFFHTLSRLMPMDLFVAIHYSMNGITDPEQLNGVYQHINLADASLHDVMQRGVAENHIHASAAFNFSHLWQLVMNNAEAEHFLTCFETNHLAESSQVYCYILVARILRLVMGKYLSELEQVPHLPNLVSWLAQILDSEKSTFVITILTDQSIADYDASDLLAVLDELKQNFGLDDGDRRHDIMFSVFPSSSHIKTYAENLFLHKAMIYKKTAYHQPDQFQSFFSVFFKYISIKNEFYQQITQSTSIKGLDFFRPYFSRATRGIRKNQDDYYTHLLRTLFQNSYLNKAEIRIPIHDQEHRIKQEVVRILGAYKNILEKDYGIRSNTNTIFPRIGIVYHLLKRDDDTDKCWSSYEGDNETTIRHLYYGRIQQAYLNQIHLMTNLRKRIPYLSNFIVGLDAASLENSTPVQVFAPVFEKARNSDHDSIRVIDRDGYVLKDQSLFFTFHAGEDFRHINSGLRRMDEVIDYCKLHSGDRIGHGIALGVDICNWVQQNKVVILPRGEYLDNMLWIWGVYSKMSHLDSKTFIYLEQKILALAEDIFQVTTGLTVRLLYEVYQKRFNHIGDSVLKAMQRVQYDTKMVHQSAQCVREMHTVRTWDKDQLLLAYHCRGYLRLMREPVHMNTTGVEEVMAQDMQKYLIEKISRQGIVIEVNPSSNEAIGEIDSIFGNQLFKLQTPTNHELSNIQVNINSDDPMVFNTNVSNEIAYLYYGMLERGIGREAALSWIEKLRKSGVNTSFIRGNVSNEEYIRMLDSVIAALDDPSYC
ncbi:hypothetical protein MKY59_25105 [Paenibacillus sp. FSL W8-0426]|uniref:hypothetical protein n=1 Tax=Paenibacillus sp. FSL W8-0426 TaxID=2921714 RepID=UPI0030DB1D4D